MLKEKSKKHEIDMCNGPILKKILLFAVPLICSSILQRLFNAADVIVVGRYAGDDALAAVGSNTSLVNLFLNLFIGLSLGVNILAAKYYGAQEKRHLSEMVHTAIGVGLVSGIVLAFAGVICAPIMLKWMQAPEGVHELAAVYLRIYFLGMPAMMVGNFGSAILRAVGDAKRPMLYLMYAGVLNVILNLFFVIVLKWSVFGVGLATTISHILTAFLVVRCLTKETGEIHLEIKKIRIYKDKFLQILRVGLPAGVQNALFSISDILIQSSINGFGAIAVAGNSAAANLEGFVYSCMIALYQANVSFTSQNMGAGKYKRINRILLTSQGCVIVVGLIWGAICCFAGSQLLSLYTDSAEVVSAGMIRIAMVSALYIFCGMMDIMVGCLRGLGYAIYPMVVSLLSSCVLRIVWLQTVFKMERFHMIETVYIIYPITWVITTVAHIITYRIIMQRIDKK